jgi:hypothetical protein
MKKIFILLLVVALLAGCQKGQLLQPIDKVDERIGEIIFSEPKQAQSHANIRIIKTTLVYGLMFSCAICLHALKTNNPGLMMKGFYIAAFCEGMLYLYHLIS